MDPLAGSGQVWMVPEATWQVGKPADRVQYSCAGQPAVVEYDWGKGHVVWWASATPLENGSLDRAQNLDSCSIRWGRARGTSFTGTSRCTGTSAPTGAMPAGPALNLLRIGLPVLAILVLFSFSRRSGPVRELPRAGAGHADRVR